MLERPHLSSGVVWAKVPKTATALKRWIKIDSRWKRKALSRWSSVLCVMRLPSSLNKFVHPVLVGGSHCLDRDCNKQVWLSQYRTLACFLAGGGGYVTDHPLLNRRCTRLPVCRQYICLRNDLYCVGWVLNFTHSYFISNSSITTVGQRTKRCIRSQVLTCDVTHTVCITLQYP